MCVYIYIRARACVCVWVLLILLIIPAILKQDEKNTVVVKGIIILLPLFAPAFRFIWYRYIAQHFVISLTCFSFFIARYTIKNYFEGNAPFVKPKFTGSFFNILNKVITLGTKRFSN